MRSILAPDSLLSLTKAWLKLVPCFCEAFLAPRERQKGLVLLSAYEALHCLRAGRKQVTKPTHAVQLQPKESSVNVAKVAQLRSVNLLSFRSGQDGQN
jgi:hypothetical protein